MTTDRTDSSEAQPTRPPNNDPDAWRAYWKALGQAWRTEPEIDPQRQEELRGRRAVTPDPDRDEQPFKDVELSRGDVEWLLATHEDGRGPVSRDVPTTTRLADGSTINLGEPDRQGLDLGGATLRIDLRHLPLDATRLVLANLVGAHLEHANLQEADLEGAELQEANLMGANLRRARLVVANLGRAQLTGAFLPEADLMGAELQGANLMGARMWLANLHYARLEEAHLEPVW